jgi:heme-degrading monooxygenase HmoA
MIKAIVGFKVKKDADIYPLLIKLRAAAMQYPGYISAENLQNQRDNSMILMQSTWQTLEAWRTWEKSRIRNHLFRSAFDLFADEPRVSVYTILATKW